MTRLLRVDEFALATGWKPATVRQKVLRGELEVVRLGRSIRFTEETLARLMRGETAKAAKVLAAEPSQ